MTARITLALLFIVPAAMAHPWPSPADKWLLGIAVAAVLVLFAWWRGLFFTTMVGRRLAMLGRRNRTEGLHHSSADTTVLLRVDPSEPGALPLRLIAGYLDRYGIRCDKLRITSRDTTRNRTTWIGLTLRATDNLAALQARSPRIPLRDTAEVAARRLADHLRETGWNVAVVDTAVPPTESAANETWRGLHDGSGYVAAYRVAVDDRLPETIRRDLGVVVAGNVDGIGDHRNRNRSRRRGALHAAFRRQARRKRTDPGPDAATRPAASRDRRAQSAVCGPARRQAGTTLR